MQKIFISIICLLALVLGGYVYASGPTAGTYTWASFSYSWNKNTPEKLQLTNAVPSSTGYRVDYGYTAVLDVMVDDGAVQGTCARFVGGGENDAGGRTFMLLIDKSITVGSFRWPKQQVEEARELFAFIGKTRKEYSYNITHFIFDYTPATGWAFCMQYLPKSASLAASPQK